MSKAIRFELAISGWQTSHIDADGAMIRPANADEIAKAIADDLQSKAQAGGLKKFRVTVKKLP